MPTITERKLISLGGSSLLIVLPKAWVDFHRLKRGDKVEVIANGGLRVRLKRQEKRRASDIQDGNESDSEGQAITERTEAVPNDESVSKPLPDTPESEGA